MQHITSKDNNLIKETKKLKDKKYRNEKGLFIIEGFRFVEEALKSNFYIETIFISENIISKFSDYGLENCLKEGTKVVSLPEGVFRSISSTDSPQGILAVVKIKSDEVFNNTNNYVLIDKVQDPGNLGTIIRTAHAAGYSGIILTKGTVDLYNEKTLRSTMGSIFNIPIIEDKDLSFTEELRNNGYKLVCSSLETDYNFYDIDFTQKLIISVGNEGNGISEELYNISDIKVKIPMPGGAESLNVAVAASIMIYEGVRQKNIK
ncbi:RNA methyltransferase [Clostridium sp.]|uniref:TrmH family RNA methyltransferase n=1 Tax=Clostridium sp. TaxID=1506 RepID=UPI002FCAC143